MNTNPAPITEEQYHALIREFTIESRNARWNAEHGENAGDPIRSAEWDAMAHAYHHAAQRLLYTAINPERDAR